jgi:fermentation-respiration switch protein FrsA (DUF1100 family)
VRRARRRTGWLMHIDSPLIATLGTVGLVASFLTAVLWVIQRQLVYFPLARAVPPAATVLAAAEDVTLDTEDGLTLGGWFLPAAPGSNEASVTVIIFNGNAGDRSFRAPLAQALQQARLGVLLFDYRGYGRNPGSPSEAGLLKDARAARAYLDRREVTQRERVVYFGESLGAAVAVGLAVEQPPAALILRSPFTSLAAMGRLHYPFLPVFDVLLRDRFDSLDQIRRVRCPLLVIAGDRDAIVPPAHSRRLYEAASDPTYFELIRGADHNDFELLAGTRLVELTLEFAAGALSREALPPQGRKR